MENSQPLISVVLCTYNGERFLREQMDSLLKQTWKPLEIIVSDDASSDGTKSILEGYAGHDHIKTFYQSKNIGLSANFAFATAQATGTFIAFCDQDDIWLSHKIKTLYDNIGAHALVYSNSLMINEAGEPLGKTLADLRHMYTGTDSRGAILYTVVSGHTMLITRALCQHALPIPKEIQHDHWLAFAGIIHGGIKYHDEILTHYRRHAATATEVLPQKTKARKKTERWKSFQKQLHWIKLMQEFERPAYKNFYTELFNLYGKKANGNYVWPLFWFMLKHREVLFMYSKKKWLSQVVEIMKQARGEREV